MTQTTSQFIARELRRRGVRHVFGMPGGVVLPLLEALREESIDFVLVRDEASAGFMADASWQLTGSPGVCVATLGPGATNLISGVSGAWLDRAEVLAITGQVAEHQRGIYTHQTLDQIALFQPITRWARTLTAESAGREIILALRQLRQGRRAPVLLNIPADVATAPVTETLGGRWSPLRTLPPPLEMSLLATRLRQSKRPMIFAGLGDLSEETASQLTQLAESLHLPVLTTYKAKGLMDETSPWSLGAAGLCPPTDALQQRWIDGCDLLLTVGLDPVELRPNWLPGWRDDLPLIVLDESAPVDLLHQPEMTVLSSIPETLASLREELGTEPFPWDLAELRQHMSQVEGVFTDGSMGPASLCRTLQSALPDDAVVALDVGAHRIVASQVWKCRRPNRLLQSNGFSSMGYGLPAAIAARLALPERTVCCLTGDMGLWMTLGELGILTERELDLIVVYFADASLSLIEVKQERMQLPRSGVRFQNPDVELLAQAFGGTGVSVRSTAALEAAVHRAREEGGLHLIECSVVSQYYRRQL